MLGLVKEQVHPSFKHRKWQRTVLHFFSSLCWVGETFFPPLPLLLFETTVHCIFAAIYPVRCGHSADADEQGLFLFFCFFDLVFLYTLVWVWIFTHHNFFCVWCLGHIDNCGHHLMTVVILLHFFLKLDYHLFFTSL